MRQVSGEWLAGGEARWVWHLMRFTSHSDHKLTQIRQRTGERFKSQGIRKASLKGRWSAILSMKRTEISHSFQIWQPLSPFSLQSFNWGFSLRILIEAFAVARMLKTTKWGRLNEDYWVKKNKWAGCWRRQSLRVQPAFDWECTSSIKQKR